MVHQVSAEPDLMEVLVLKVLMFRSQNVHRLLLCRLLRLYASVWACLQRKDLQAVVRSQCYSHHHLFLIDRYCFLLCFPPPVLEVLSQLVLSFLAQVVRLQWVLLQTLTSCLMQVLIGHL